jgi:hypothetical protein
VGQMPHQSMVLKNALQCSFINHPFFCMLKYLNKEESKVKVIFMREFEISLFQTQ